ncbi:hypothetical protein LSCM1_01133 [Leishmania martiniquensis]|uniref:Sfi1 spindle body domain-containing protein n=1 Tax=Leishmania martiniquensis TaxID=1580590 RepID=A0A836KDM1_9TRYP|nr:hypothetical protein LSCM1_01133 [Leishmania martiniquensis]
MRHLRARIHNFYEDDGAVPGADHSKEKRTFGLSPGPPPSLPSVSHGVDAPPHGAGVRFLGHPALREQAELSGPSRSDSSSCSSASIECVIRCKGRTLSHDVTAGSTQSPFMGVECMSLRQLQESLEEAVCDVRRVDMLARKAVWHALIQRPGPRGANHRARGATASAQKVSPRKRRCAPNAAVMHHGAPDLSESTALVHEKPFLPPDRYPMTPTLQSVPDHFARNLSRALFAAHRAGLLEKQRARMQGRLLPNATDAAVAAASSSPSPASTRRTALQRVSRLASSAAAASQSDGTTAACGGSGVGASTVGPADGKEGYALSSVSLIILRIARARAIATVFLRQLRLEVHKRRALRDSVDLRYSYYAQRRLLRWWSTAATMQRCRRVSLLKAVVLHWQCFARMRKGLHSVLSTWRRALQERSRAFAACRQAQRQRWFHRWLQAFTWHRERSALYEAASQFAASQQRRHHSETLRAACGSEAEMLALLQGRLHASGNGTVAATVVGPRLLLRRLFLAWRQRTEWRLMVYLAAWHHAQQLRVNVARRVCSCARRLALQHHRNQPEHQRHRWESAAQNAHSGGIFSEEQSRTPLRVHIVAGEVRGLLKYKARVACCIARTAELRRRFDRWRARFQARRADRFHLQCVYTHTVCQWLGAVFTRRARRQRKLLIFSRWAAALKLCRAAAAASKVCTYKLARHTLRLWRGRLSVRLMRRARLLQGCFERWRDRKLLQSASRALRCVRQRRLLRHWNQRAQTRLQARTNLYVADTISETALVLGCFRQWRFRAAERHRAHLAWSVLVQLRRERMSRRCFDVWRRRTFGPPPPWARHLDKDTPLAVGHRS